MSSICAKFTGFSGEQSLRRKARGHLYSVLLQQPLDFVCQQVRSMVREQRPILRIDFKTPYTGTPQMRHDFSVTRRNQAVLLTCQSTPRLYQKTGFLQGKTRNINHLLRKMSWKRKGNITIMSNIREDTEDPRS